MQDCYKVIPPLVTSANPINAYQIRFKTPETLETSTLQGSCNTTSVGNSNFLTGISFPENYTKIKFTTATEEQEFDYNFAPDTWYTLLAEMGWFDGNWRTQIKINNEILGIVQSRFFNSTDFLTCISCLQIGCSNNGSLFNGAVDLTQTGFFNAENNFEMYFAEKT